MAAENSPFTSMPLDLLENIFELLNLDDIRNLRLTCKNLGVIGPNFKSFFANQTTDLSSESLHQKLSLASHPQLRSAVSTLVVMAVVIDTSELDRIIKTRRRRIVQVQGVFTTTTEPNCTEEELSQAAKDLEWMHSKQSSQNSRDIEETSESLAVILKMYGTLDTIDVDACVIKGPDKCAPVREAEEWLPVFARASEVFQITTTAIVKSQISPKTLLVYRATQRCSIPSFDITMHTKHLESLPGFESTLSQLENFALSFSTRVPTDFSKIEAARAGLEGAAAAFHNAMGSSAGQYSSEDAEATAEDNFPGVARLLKPMTKLDAFDLHMINALKGTSTNYEKIFTEIAEEVKLPLLTQVFLRGLPCSEESLLKFMDNHPTINDFNIREVNLTSGSWKNVIQRLCLMPNLAHLSLSNLCSEEGVFNLLSKNTDEEQRSKYARLRWSIPCLGGLKVHTRLFDREEIEKLRVNIDFDDKDMRRPLGSPMAMYWYNTRRAEFSL